MGLSRSWVDVENEVSFTERWHEQTSFVPSRWKPQRPVPLPARTDTAMQSASCRPKGNASFLWLVTSKTAPVRWTSTVSLILMTLGQQVMLLCHCCLCTWGKASSWPPWGIYKVSSSPCFLFIINWNCFLESRLMRPLFGPHPLICLCPLTLLLAATSWTPTHVPAVPGPWVLEPLSLSSSSSRLTLCLLPGAPSLSLLKSYPAQVPVSLWMKSFRSSPADGNLSFSEPPRARWACPIFLPSLYLVIWVLVLSFQAVSLSVQGPVLDWNPSTSHSA